VSVYFLRGPQVILHHLSGEAHCATLAEDGGLPTTGAGPNFGKPCWSLFSFLRQ